MEVDASTEEAFENYYVGRVNHSSVWIYLGFCSVIALAASAGMAMDRRIDGLVITVAEVWSIELRQAAYAIVAASLLLVLVSFMMMGRRKD